MRIDFSAFYSRKQVADLFGIQSGNLSAARYATLTPDFKQGRNVYYLKEKVHAFLSTASAPPPEGLYSATQAAAYLGIAIASFYTAATRRGLKPDYIDGTRNYYKKDTLDSYRLRHPNAPHHTPDSIPPGYITLPAIVDEFGFLFSKSTPKNRRNCIWCVLSAAAVPYIKIRPHRKSPTFSHAYEKEAAFAALRNYTPRERAKPEENHLIAPPEILRSAKWVTCRRAAEIIGCTAGEVSSRAAKYSFKSYLHPQTKKLLVNWLEVKERMKWRKPAFIIKHLGAAGYNLVRRTCEKKRSTHGTLYLVPELIGAELSYSER